MMVLPFAFFAAAIFAGWRRHSMLAVLCWVLGMAATLAMFRYHVSSSLDLAFLCFIMVERVFVILNALGLLALSGALGFALADQIIFDDLPCPLCLLQRMAMFAVGVGLVLNIAVEHRPRHYGLMILSAVVGMFMSIRQILLHIVPGTGAYGDAFLGLHFYTWAFILFVGVIFGASLMLVFMPQSAARERVAIPLLGTIAIGVFFVLALANVIGTTLECGAGPCADDPTSYELLDRLLGHRHVQ